ncbi:MAG: zinc-ribbon domain-containing protein [Clostridiales bacterium]|nr:zinc-ribbon domain-containing protein [Clostridiales bacterium]
MFCKQCGNEIPEGGKFCPECGTPVSPKAPSAKKRPKTTEQTARPLADNPFQPHRAPAHVIKADKDVVLDIPEEPVAEEPVEEDTAPTENAIATDMDATIPPMPKPLPRKRVRPVIIEESEEDAEDTDEDTEDAINNFLEEESAQESTSKKVPLFGGNKQTIAPVPHGVRRANTLVPKRIVPTEEDELENFFNDEDSAEDAEDYGEGQTFLERNLRGLITAGLLIATILIFICYLTFSSSGKVFMAGLGITKDAYAYKLLGDQYTDSKQLKSASDAYYLALKYDPDNYDYAIQSARAFYAIQDKELAAKACQLAIDLNPNQKEPYTFLAEMFPANARPGNIASILDEAATRFNDSSLTQ